MGQPQSQIDVMVPQRESFPMLTIDGAVAIRKAAGQDGSWIYLVGALHGFGLNRGVQRWLNAQAAPSGALHLVWRG
jgi:hypothetical protein